jgi:phosphoglycolate phosphatase-like HAD superfamily hydrolase
VIKLIAFDWNGTLLSDMQIVWRADNAALKNLKLKAITLLEFKQAFDIPVIKYWRNVGLSEKFLKKNLKKLELVFIKDYQANENKAKLRAKARECVNWIKAQKITSVIYSNAPTAHVEMHLKRLNIAHIFNSILGREQNDMSHLLVRGKQQRLHDWVLKNKIKPHEVISVGDTQEEIEIGKHLGYHTVAITGGYNTTSRLKKHHPDFLIHNMLELKKIIKKLNI